ncbi:hypothetical protein BC833DRAFT_95305 [Globomyces pollinis-pini]|nr:hypothetical protein BC833DRAFT_95305 [Globomyces pollinis-pini]
MNKETNATTKLKELTSKLTLLEQKNMSIDHPLTSTTTETSHLRELTAARIEIESIKAELKLSIEEGSTFKAISQASEERLNEMNEAYDVYKEEMEKKIQASNTTIQKLENDCAELREQLSNLRQTLTETQDQLDNQQENFKGERALYELQIEASKKAEEQAVKHVVEMRNDVKMQTKLAQEAQSSYQREVMAHSTSLQTVMNLKKVNEEIKAERELALV